MKILLVDDEEGIRKVLGISLMDAGYEVVTAENADTAMDLVRELDPPVVLTDIKMPGKDGIELLCMIKKEKPDTEVIMITGHGDMDLAIRSLKFDATDYISKPINDDALEMALKKALERIEMRARLKEHTDNLEQLVEEKTRELIEAERLAAVGQTVAGLSHAIKNIAGGLKGGAYVLEKGIETDDRTYLLQGWEMVKGNVDKITGLSMDLLNFTRPREPELVPCNPNLPAGEVYDLMASRARENHIDFRFEPAEELDPVPMDPIEIHTCLLNLVTNAMDACRDLPENRAGKRVTVSTGKSDEWGVVYRVEDNCGGMDEAVKSRIFQIFFSTKGTRGTGIGLMITRKIVEMHGGIIEVTSDRGKGSTFTIKLPS